MKTTIEHKYSIGDKVYIVSNRNIKEVIVDRMEIIIQTQPSIEYRLKDGSDYYSRSEKQVYKSITTT
jgi:hypothetical protein